MSYRIWVIARILFSYDLLILLLWKIKFPLIIMFSRMNTPPQQQGLKAFRWKPQDYLSNHLYKRGKTCFFGSSKHQEPSNVQIFRKTEFRMNSRMVSDFKRASATPTNKSVFDSLEHSTNKGKNRSLRKAIKIQKSPYLSSSLGNSNYLQKMMRLLVPVKGPNDSVKLQIKKHNDMNIRNAQLMIVKKQDNFSDRMKAYSARMGLPQDTKLFIINSKDAHIKQALTRRGWIESTDKMSILFHLKWTYKDELSDYQCLQQGQYFNHFKDNQELTNKNYLRKNIRKFPQSQRPNFPLSYNLDNSEDLLLFQESYALFEAYQVLNNVVETLKLKHQKLWKKVIQSKLYFQNSLQRNVVLVNNQGNLSILYTENIETLKTQVSSWDSLNNLFRTVSMVARQVGRLRNVNYSYFNHKPKNQEKNHYVKNLKKSINYGDTSFLNYLSPFYLVQIFKLQHQVEQLVGPNYGFDNMWILKPAGVSRGSGITITSETVKINQLKHGKIVQKYIQHPYLLNCRRKFDIRQWVLVKSFNPLMVYTYKKCYARLSSVKYSNQNYENLPKHLTNYSQNKETFSRQKLKIKDHLSMTSSMFMNTVLSEEELACQIPDWTTVKENILFQIIKTLICCKGEIQQRQGCFEVYGFDIILDQNLKPYVLQVNMSPACERRQFLNQYLTEMADGLVNMLEGGQPTSWVYLSQGDYQQRFLARERVNKLAEKAKMIQQWWRRIKKRNPILN